MTGKALAAANCSAAVAPMRRFSPAAWTTAISADCSSATIPSAIAPTTIKQHQPGGPEKEVQNILIETTALPDTANNPLNISVTSGVRAIKAINLNAMPVTKSGFHDDRNTLRDVVRRERARRSEVIGRTGYRDVSVSSCSTFGSAGFASIRPLDMSATLACAKALCRFAFFGRQHCGAL
jgi:hypothetical protein